MISPLRLERPGWPGATVLAVLLALSVAPLLPFARAALEGPGPGQGFTTALVRGLLIAGLSAFVAFALGWPAGTLAALYRLPASRPLQTLLLLPLLLPSFAWALAWADAWRRLPRPDASSLPPLILAHAGATLALVFITAKSAAHSLSASQRDALRLAGGEPTLRRAALRHTASAAALAAFFGALVALSDAGPSLVFGRRTAAYEVLTSFAATYDQSLAARQCAALLVVALVLALPFLWLALPRLGHVLLERVPAHPRSTRDPRGERLLAVTLVAALLTTLPALGALASSPWSGAALAAALGDLRRTAADTVLYSVAAAAVAVGLGGLAGLAAGRSRFARTLVLAGALALLALPPAALALGVLQMSGNAPPALDVLLRGRAIVGLTLGLRLAPLAALLALRALASAPPSWSEAAAMHGVKLRLFLSRVLLPWLRPALAAAFLLVALLAAADAPTVLLLHPPGHPSLPLALLTVMSNAPQAYVSALVAVYVGGAGLVLWLATRPRFEP